MADSTSTGRIRVIITDDHPVVLNGLNHLLHEYPEFEVVDKCGSGRDALAAVRRHRPDILVLDLMMPGMDGLEVARELHRSGDMPYVVLLTAQLHEDQLIEALHLGVRGFILKEMATKLLVECLRRVHAGEKWLEKQSGARAIDRVAKRESDLQQLSRILTPRELEIVRLVAEGLRNREIAERLTITEGTVKIHLHNIYEKLGVSGRPQLILFATRQGLSPDMG